MTDVLLDVPSPLQECFVQCEVVCVRECCGIDAISTDPALIANWANLAGPIAVAEARRQLDELIVAVSDRTKKISMEFLNHYTCDENARLQLLNFLSAFRNALSTL